MKRKKTEQPEENKKMPTDVTVGFDETGEKVVVTFSREINWIGLDPLTAINLAESLKSKAIEILKSEPKAKK